MAICLRRALSGRSLALFHRASRHISSLSPLSYLSSDGPAPVERKISLPFRGPSFRSDAHFFIGHRRGFSKAKKSKAEDDDEAQADPNIGPIAKSTAQSQMDAAVIALTRELSKLRTGRASAGMLDHIIVEIAGAKMPLNHVTVVSVIDSQTLSVTPYDPDSLKPVESAITSSPLGLNPQPDGQRIIVAIPPLTKETKLSLCKVVTKSSEDVKQSIRRARQKAMDTIKKAASKISKDDAKRLEKEIDEMTKRFVKTADDTCKLKEREINGS